TCSRSGGVGSQELASAPSVRLRWELELAAEEGKPEGSPPYQGGVRGGFFNAASATAPFGGRSLAAPSSRLIRSRGGVFAPRPAYRRYGAPLHQQPLEVVEAAVPESPLRVNPVGHRVERRRVDGDAMLAARHFAAHETGALQQLDVLRHGVE